MKDDPPKDSAVLAVAAVITHAPVVTDPYVVTVQLPAMAEMAVATCAVVALKEIAVEVPALVVSLNWPSVGFPSK